MQEYTPQIKTAVRLLEEEFNENEFVALTLQEVRAFFDGEELEAVETALDQAQGDISSGQKKEAYILIKITEGG